VVVQILMERKMDVLVVQVEVLLTIMELVVQGTHLIHHQVKEIMVVVVIVPTIVILVQEEVVLVRLEQKHSRPPQVVLELHLQ
jgi:hypothetical protein